MSTHFGDDYVIIQIFIKINCKIKTVFKKLSGHIVHHLTRVKILLKIIQNNIFNSSAKL